ncbi:MAG: DUF362 domain-containing protein [bacterium]
MASCSQIGRREFLAGSVGSVLLSGCGHGVVTPPQVSRPARSKVVLARDPSLIANHRPQREPMRRLLAHSMCAFYECKDERDAWASLFSPDDVVGLKVNCASGRVMSTSVPLVEEICEALHRVGVPYKNMIVWDANDRTLRHGGFRMNTDDPTRYQCFGAKNPRSGYDKTRIQIVEESTRYCRIVTEMTTKIINVPILKSHLRTGVTMAFKNHYGSIINPIDHHANMCHPAVCRVYNHKPLVEKSVLIVTDCSKSIFDGGPSYSDGWMWYPNAMLVATDPVANDFIGWKMIEEERRAREYPTLEEAGRPARFLATAAEMGLGNNSDDRIDLVEIGS